MTKDQIYQYALHTPDNTNPNVLRSLLDNLETGGGDIGDTTGLEQYLSGAPVVETNAKFIPDHGFDYNLNVTQVSIPEAEWVGYQGFYFCENLESIYAPKVKKAGFESFYGCEKLTNISFPELEEIEESGFQEIVIDEITEEVFPKLKVIGDYGFYNNTATIISLPYVEVVGEDSVSGRDVQYVSLPSLKAIPEFFIDSWDIEEVYLPSATTIDSQAFNYTAITNLTLPSLIKTVGWASFGNMENLTYLDLPKMQFIGDDAFDGTENIQFLLLRNDKVCELEDVTLPTNENFGVYVPRSLVEAYKSHEAWQVVADRIYPLEDYTVDGTINGALAQE